MFHNPHQAANHAATTPADKTAQAVGYKDYAAYQATWTSIEFLGKDLGQGHPFLAARMKLADAFLRQLNPQATSKKELWGAVGWSGAGNAAYDASADSGQSHVHTMGLAIDIDKAQNPWMLGLTINAERKNNNWWVFEYFQPVFEIAAKLFGGEGISIDSLNKWSEEMSTEELFDKVHASSEAFVQLKNLATTKSKHEIIEVLKTKYPDHEAEDKYEKYLKKLPELWGPSKAKGGDRFGRTQDTRSFTNHSELLLVALRDVAGLAWGGSELHKNENGDFMHFDCRHTGFGRDVYDAGARAQNEAKKSK